MPTAKAAAGKTLLSPTDHTLILVDFQPQMAFATKSIDGVVLRNNAALVANAAKGFKVSTILATLAEKTFFGPMFVEEKNLTPRVFLPARITVLKLLASQAAIAVEIAVCTAI